MFIFVIYSIDPDEFYGIVSAEEGVLSKIGALIRDTCDRLMSGDSRVDLSSAPLSNIMVKLGPTWFRCSKIDPNSANDVKITLLDAGNRIITAPKTCPAVKMTKAIYDLKSHKFSLAAVEPVVGQSWSKSAKEAFSALTVGKVFELPNYGASSSAISMTDLKSGKQVSVELADLGFAKLRDPSSTLHQNDLPMESRIFLERSGGIDFTEIKLTSGIPSEIVKSLSYGQRK